MASFLEEGISKPVKSFFMLTAIQETNTDDQANLMNTLTERINKAVKDGYIDNLKVTKHGLYSPIKDKTYLPSEVTIIDFSRFEGTSDPADNSILYLIETSDGVKGTLVDAYGAYADANVNKFIIEVEEITKKEKTVKEP